HDLPMVVRRTINHYSERSYDPLDMALINFSTEKNAINSKGTSVAKLPFDQKFAMSGNIWRRQSTHELVVKGAPEQVMMRSRLTRAQMSEVSQAVLQLTSQGYRVIALATASIDEPFETFDEMSARQKLDFAGLVAVADTLRPSARRAIAAAHRAGVTVRMITGDHFETALSIGTKLGLVESRD